MGSPVTFVIATLVILVWALSGPIFHYSDAWQLVINTGTTIFTFLMVILIQNTQNRDARAIQLKLDELIRAVRGARNSLVDLESLSDAELEDLHKQFEDFRKKNCSGENSIDDLSDEDSDEPAEIANHAEAMGPDVPPKVAGKLLQLSERSLSDRERPASRRQGS